MMTIRVGILSLATWVLGCGLGWASPMPITGTSSWLVGTSVFTRTTAGIAPAWMMAKTSGGTAGVDPSTSDAISALELQDRANQAAKQRMTSGQPIDGSRPAQVGGPIVQRPAFNQPGANQFFRCRRADGRVELRNFGCREGETQAGSLAKTP